MLTSTEEVVGGIGVEAMVTVLHWTILGSFNFILKGLMTWLCLHAVVLSLGPLLIASPGTTLEGVTVADKQVLVEEPWLAESAFAPMYQGIFRGCRVLRDLVFLLVLRYYLILDYWRWADFVNTILNQVLNQILLLSVTFETLHASVCNKIMHGSNVSVQVFLMFVSF